MKLARTLCESHCYNFRRSGCCEAGKAYIVSVFNIACSLFG
jgi:hypothetical protein